jgi:hypothetical protein
MKESLKESLKDALLGGGPIILGLLLAAFLIIATWGCARADASDNDLLSPGGRGYNSWFDQADQESAERRRLAAERKLLQQKQFAEQAEKQAREAFKVKVVAQVQKKIKSPVRPKLKKDAPPEAVNYMKSALKHRVGLIDEFIAGLDPKNTTLAAATKELLALYSTVPDIPFPEGAHLEVGMIGIFSGGVKLTQVVNDQEMLVEYSSSRLIPHDRVVGGMGPGAMVIREEQRVSATDSIWIGNRSTKGLVDGRGYYLPDLFYVTGTKRYDTAWGSTCTVLTVEPFNIEEYIERPEEEK